jgi:hypothetical protein
MEIDTMKKILMAAAGALLVSGSSLAFAANSGSMSSAAPTTEHCSYLETQAQAKPATTYSAARHQTAEQNTMSLCRQDKHKNDVAKFGSGPTKSSRAAE